MKLHKTKGNAVKFNAQILHVSNCETETDSTGMSFLLSYDKLENNKIKLY